MVGCIPFGSVLKGVYICLYQDSERKDLLSEPFN